MENLSRRSLSSFLLLESPGLDPTGWQRGLRNGEVKGDGGHGGTEAPLFGAQASPGKGFMPRAGRGAPQPEGGHQLPGLLPLGPGGGQVPSRMPSGLIEGSVVGSLGRADPKKSCGAERPRLPAPPLGRMSLQGLKSRVLNHPPPDSNHS